MEWDEVSSGSPGSKPQTWARGEADTLFRLLFFILEVPRGRREGGAAILLLPSTWPQGPQGRREARPYQAGRRVVSSPVGPGEV